ncbi:hypothetical protein HHL11_20850 [Ramlibacter sp. G-1-2-2]|uniref:Chalcone isomerase domain-containing protein n=1 Tax=Ramlibacter agri TaxID=2728837 RepID=A0A848H9U8_9BURK|nr:chalcone isomerase family protein [Ramlibacter agri]NML46210.1 hypothetical protein [Ramlibacter agri]
MPRVPPVRRVIPSSLAALALVASTLAVAAPTQTNFPSEIQVAGTRLQLNGAGTRYKAVFKVYDLGLYTAAKASSPDTLLKQAGPMRLQFTALRELPGTDLGLLFIKGLQENSPKDKVQKHAVSSNRLIEIFSGKSKLVPGDTFAMEYVPGKGTQFFIQDQPQGAPVGDAEFFGMILKIWVGDAPADHLLKKALLALDQ